MKDSFIGIGIYSIPEASLLTGVPAARIKRWMTGYNFKNVKGQIRHSEPVWAADLHAIDGALALSFKDLIEVRFVDAFLKHHVSWSEIRQATKRAIELWNTDHPFATRRFKTDGRKIIAAIGKETKSQKLLELSSNQLAFNEIVSPFLFDGLEFKKNELIRWRPKAGSNLIVLDPKRSFGQPITDNSSIPTKILAAAVQAEGEGSEKNVAKWYGISSKEVNAAVGFESTLQTQRPTKIAA